MKPAPLAATGSVGGSLGYLVAAVPTVWLDLLPAIPDPHFLPIVGALGVLFSAVLVKAFGINGKPKE